MNTAVALATAAALFSPARMVAFDLETYQIEPGLLAPRIVCGSFATKGSHRLELRDEALATVRRLLEDPERIIVGANIAFDWGCVAAADVSMLPLIFKAYAEGRVFDVQIAQALHAIAEGNLYLDPRTGEELATVDPLTGKRRRGRYSLERCVDLVLGREDAKARDYWRRRYALLDGVPIDEWPEDAREYPLDDARNTLEVAVAQAAGGGVGCTPGPHRNLGDLSAQAETAFAMHLGAVWGVRTDGARVHALRAKVEKLHEKYVEKFKALGFFDADGKEKRDVIKCAVIRAYGGGEKCNACVGGRVLSPKSGEPINCKACSGSGLDPSLAPRTPTGGVSADRDAKLESGDPDLVALGDNEPEKIKATYLPFVETGVNRPITLKPNILVASGRTSYDGVIQLIPKEGDVRECFKAREGYVYCSVDYSAIELCTLAQVCYWILGRSQMMETINATGKPGALHTAFAASLAGITAEEMTARLDSKDKATKEWATRYRQAAKAGNFGFPGGMGSPKFVFAKRKKSEGTTTAPDGTVYPGIRFCLLLGGAERCGVEKVTEWNGRPCPAALCKRCVEIVDRDIRPAWFRQWPEIKPYFEWVTRRVDAGGEFLCLPTERVRGGCDFTNGANHNFQALAADGAKRALRAVTRECYLDRASPLFGSRPLFFAHDEIFSELVADRAHAAAYRKAEIMVAAMRELVPDVTVKAEPALCRWWTKTAESAFDASGTLIPWEDRRAS